MTHPSDLDLTSLGALWRSSDLPVPQTDALLSRMRRRERTARRSAMLTLMIEVLITAGVFVLLSSWVPLDSPLAGLAWTLAVVHTAALWIATLWLRRGLWSRVADTSAAYLASLRRRATAQRAGAEAGGVILTVEAIALGIAWVRFAGAETAPSLLRPSLLAITLFSAGGALCVAQWLAARRQHALLDEIEHDADSAA